MWRKQWSIERTLRLFIFLISSQWILSNVDKWNQQFRNYFANGDPLDGDLVDESKRDPETSDYYNDYPEYHGPGYDTDCSDG